MKWLKNVGVRAKLLLIAVPMAIALVAALIFMVLEIRSVEEEVTGIYYDILYGTVNPLVNADRDFYQAYLAAMQNFDARWDGEDDDAALKGYMEDYEKNAQQVTDNLAAAAEAAKKNDTLYNSRKGENGKTFAETYTDFEKDYKKPKPEDSLIEGDLYGKIDI